MSHNEHAHFEGVLAESDASSGKLQILMLIHD
jgi:hypothetical protein